MLTPAPTTLLQPPRPHPGRVVPEALGELAELAELEARLQALAATVAAGARPAGALRDLLLALSRCTAPRALDLAVFAAGLAVRVQGEAAEQANLYLSRFELPQIELFDLLGRALPYVGLATAWANREIAAALRGQPEATLIDVGIGLGRQLVQLLETESLPPRLRIIGIEPSDWALEAAAQTLKTLARAKGIALDFVGLPCAAEDLEAAGWQRLGALCSGPVVVNAAFALHHLAERPGTDARLQLLQRLQGLRPALLLLAEPDADHAEPEFGRRWANCFAHFGAVFRTLDRLGLPTTERDALKVFFGREIADILGQPEALRSERHESAAHWCARLRAAGFELRPGGCAALVHPQVQARARTEHLCLGLDGDPVVALIKATPRA